MTLDFSRCRTVRLADGTDSPPPEHVKHGVAEIVAHPFYMLADGMGVMKTAQTIIAAQFLSEMGIIDRVIVVAPSSVIPVWYDRDLGQMTEQLWLGKKSLVSHYHQRIKRWVHEPEGTSELRWITTNYEFIRREKRCEELLQYCSQKTLLVLDESSAVKGESQQTDACMALRKRCGRVLLLNGTPIADSPMDLFTQGNLMDPSILECKYVTHFRARYAQLAPVLGYGGQALKDKYKRDVKTIVGWQNLEDLQRRFAPYVLRREAKSVGIDFALPPVPLEVRLTERTWKIYKEKRDDMVAWLTDTLVSVTHTAAVKSMRLAQITSGFLGGVEESRIGDAIHQPGLLESLDLGHSIVDPHIIPSVPMFDDDLPASYGTTTQEVGREKLDFALEWQAEELRRDPNLKLLVWSRHVPELRRYLNEVTKFGHQVGAVSGQSMLGGRVKDERAAAIRMLHPKTAPEGPVTVGGTYGTGALGLNFTACRTVLDMSYDFSPWKKSQGDARVNRTGQTGPVRFYYLIAVGPRGQKTIDHHIVMTRLGKQNVADWTAAAWVRALEEE